MPAESRVAIPPATPRAPVYSASIAVRASALVAPAAMTAGLSARVVHVSFDADPVSPLGIAMSKTAADEVPTLVTEALLPGTAW